VHPSTRRGATLVTGLLFATLGVAASDDHGATAFAASKCAPPGDALCSVGREPARLSVRGAVAHGLLTNDGPRNVSEQEVNSGKSYLSGCVRSSCVLYWPPPPQGEGRWAIVPRRNVAVRRPRKGGPWVSAAGKVAGERVRVRRLGGAPSPRPHEIRKLIANPALKGIYHPTNGGGGHSPLLNYSCSDFREPGCRYVTIADAPPNTPQGGKGYTSGIYTSGTTFYATSLTTRVPILRIDKSKGMSRWVYGFIRWRGGRVWGWVIHSVRIREPNGSVTTYPGYLR